MKYETRALVRKSWRRARTRAGFVEREWAQRTAQRFAVSVRTVRNIVADGADTEGLRSRRHRDRLVRGLAEVVEEVVLTQGGSPLRVRRRLGGNKSKLAREFTSRTGEGIARKTIRSTLEPQPTPAEPRSARA